MLVHQTSPRQQSKTVFAFHFCKRSVCIQASHQHLSLRGIPEAKQATVVSSLTIDQTRRDFNHVLPPKKKGKDGYNSAKLKHDFQKDTSDVGWLVSLPKPEVKGMARQGVKKQPLKSSSLPQHDTGPSPKHTFCLLSNSTNVPVVVAVCLLLCVAALTTFGRIPAIQFSFGACSPFTCCLICYSSIDGWIVDCVSIDAMEEMRYPCFGGGSNKILLQPCPAASKVLKLCLSFLHDNVYLEYLDTGLGTKCIIRQG